MPIPLSAIGFRAGTNQEFADLAERAAKDSTEIRVADGSYLLWECPSGVQLWLQLDLTGNVIGMNPHYRGTASLSVALSTRISRQNDTLLDGAFYAYASPKGDLDSEGVPEDYYYPFVFDCPDFACHAGWTLPLRAMAQVTAFAYEFSLFWTKADLDAVGGPGWQSFADQHFISSGLGLISGERFNPPESRAIVGGYVRTAEARVNRMTGLRFVAIEIESWGGDYTMVVDPTLTDKIPPSGSIVAGQFWLSSRFVPPEQLEQFAQLGSGTASVIRSSRDWTGPRLGPLNRWAPERPRSAYCSISSRNRLQSPTPEQAFSSWYPSGNPTCKPFVFKWGPPPYHGRKMSHHHNLSLQRRAG